MGYTYGPYGYGYGMVLDLIQDPRQYPMLVVALVLDLLLSSCYWSYCLSLVSGGSLGLVVVILDQFVNTKKLGLICRVFSYYNIYLQTS